MTARHTRVVKKGLEFLAEETLAILAREGSRSKLTYKWKSSKPQGKWKEISVEMDALG